MLESPERFSAICRTIAAGLAVVGIVGLVDRLLALPLAGLFAVFAVLAHLVAQERREHVLSWADVARPAERGHAPRPPAIPPAPAVVAPTPPVRPAPTPAPEPVPLGPAKVTRTFRLPIVDGAARANIVGDFNDWSRTATPMTRTGDHFTVVVELEAGRSYRYRYLLDGERWENDWAADRYVPNGYGQDDSVVDV